MLPKGLEACTPSDWSEAIIRATKYAHLLSARLPRHLTVEDVVHTAVQKVLSGTRSIDLQKYSLAAVLCGKIKSTLSPKGPAEYTRRMPLASAEELAQAQAADPDEGNLFSAADRELIMARVVALAGSDRVLVDYIEAYRANFSAPEIAQLLSLRIEDCYELKRKLRHLTVQAVQELKPADLESLTS